VRALIVTNDRVLLDYAGALLRDAGIEAIVLDRHISAIEGAIGAFPQRLLVRHEDWHRARRVLIEAGLAHWLVGDGDA
jgi:hypothetical protein